MVRRADQPVVNAARESAPLRRPSSLGEEVYDVLFGQLISLQIAPGSRINIDTLARDLGVSHTPIREALARLESEGLIQKTHLIGYRAAPQIDRKQFEDLYDLRLLIEPHAAARAAASMSDAALEGLAALSDKMTEEVSDASAYATFAKFDKMFHDEIARAAGNAYVESILGSLHTHVHLFRLMYHSKVTREALKEHAAIVAALKDRDPVAAAKAMRVHIAKSQKRFAAKFDQADNSSAILAAPPQ